MDNKDNAIMLNKNHDVSLFPEISLRTADYDGLRFFLDKQVRI